MNIGQEVVYKLDALVRTADHVISYDFDTENYVAINLTAPMNPLMLEYHKVRTIALPSLEVLVQKHVQKEMKK